MRANWQFFSQNHKNPKNSKNNNLFNNTKDLKNKNKYLINKKNLNKKQISYQKNDENIENISGNIQQSLIDLKNLKNPKNPENINNNKNTEEINNKISEKYQKLTKTLMQNKPCYQQWFKAGALIWPLANILRLNITGLDFAAAAFAKQFLNTIISPFCGAYADIAVGMWMQLTVSGMPNLAKEIKNSKSYAELSSNYQALFKEISEIKKIKLNKKINKEGFDQKIIELKAKKAALDLEFKRQNAYLKIYLLPNFRTCVNVAATIILAAIIFSSGGLGLLPALLSIPAIYILRAIASGFDNLFKLKLTQTANLKYSNLAQNPETYTQKTAQKAVDELWLNAKSIRQQTILEIYVQKIGKYQYQIDQFKEKISKHISKKQHITAAGKIYFYIHEMQQKAKKIKKYMHEYDIVKKQKIADLDVYSLAARCFLSDKTLLWHSLFATFSSSNVLRQQIVKNLGALHQTAFVANPVLMSIAADVIRYESEGLLSTNQTSATFISFKTAANIISAFGRNLSSGSRQLVKKIFKNAENIKSKQSKQSEKSENIKQNTQSIITYKLTTKDGHELDLLACDRQYIKHMGRWRIYGLMAKSIWVSMFAIFSIPKTYLSAKKYKKIVDNILT